MLSESPTVKYWTSWLIFINAGTAGLGIAIFVFPVCNNVNIQTCQFGMTLAPRKGPEILHGNRSSKDIQLLFQFSAL